MGKLEELTSLHERYADCQLCPALCASRAAPVFGSGSSSAPIVIIGAGPSGEENESGIPFSGQAGRRLLELIAMAWPDKESIAAFGEIEDADDYFEALRDYLDGYIYWMNITACYAPEGRAPTSKEVTACRPLVRESLYIVDPRLIIALGKEAATALVGKSVQVTERHPLKDITIPSPETDLPIRYPLLALPSPSYLIRVGDEALMSRNQGQHYNFVTQLTEAFDLLNTLYQDTYGTDFPHKE
jgi:uracil-DNA glycosylase